MRDVTEFIVGLAALIAIVAGALYINAHVSWGCIFGSCAFIIH